MVIFRECIICNLAPDEDTAGFFIKPVTFFRGEKTGAMVPDSDMFPDREAEKFLCFRCCPEELLEYLGFQGLEGQ